MPDIRSAKTIQREQQDLDERISDELDFVVGLYKNFALSQHGRSLTPDQIDQLKNEVEGRLLASG